MAAGMPVSYKAPWEEHFFRLLLPCSFPALHVVVECFWTCNSYYLCDLGCFFSRSAKKLAKIDFKMTMFRLPNHLLMLTVVLFLFMLQTSDGRKSTRPISTKRSSTRQETATSTSSIPSSPSISYNLSVVTWNLAEKKPTDHDCTFLKQFRGDDFVVFGVQECENIKPRREEGHRSRAWRAIQKSALGKAYICLAQHRMGGMQIAGDYSITSITLVQHSL